MSKTAVADAPPETVPAESASAPAVVEPAPDPGGTFVNAGLVNLTLLDPAAVLKPGRVIELPYTPTHRDLRPATAAEIKAARAADAADAAAAATADTTRNQE